jgi:hypothetical protein
MMDLSRRASGAPRLLAALVLASSLLGCSPPPLPLSSASESIACTAAGDLSTARTLVRQAAAKGSNGDRFASRQLLRQATGLVNRTSRRIQAVLPADLKKGDAWQALNAAHRQFVRTAMSSRSD